MATFNGGEFIQEQIISILEGKLLPNKILVGDDGSSDNSIDLLKEAAKRSPVEMDIQINSKRLGPGANFLALLQRVPVDADYVAFADQDDIWEPDKLARAIGKLQDYGKRQPSLYCSRQKLVDEQGRYLKLSPEFRHLPSFANALVQNIVTGCTTVINRAALELALTTGSPDVKFHDWWLYLLVSGCEGNIIFDPESTIRYRQHNSNVAGSPTTVFISLQQRFKRQLTRTSSLDNNRNMRALAEQAELLSPSNRKLFHSFDAARKASLWRRLSYLLRFEPYRHTLLDNLILRVLFLLKRV